MRRMLLLLGILLAAQLSLADPTFFSRPPVCIEDPGKGGCFNHFSCSQTQFLYTCGVVACNNDKGCDDGKASTHDKCLNPGQKASCSSQTQAQCSYTSCPVGVQDANDDPSDGCESSIFDFSVSVSPASKKILAGDPAEATVKATRTDVGGLPTAVSLSPSGTSPEGVYAVEFAPPSCTPSPECTSKASFKTSQEFGTTGTYPITITGSGGGKLRSATYSLEVVGCNNDKKCEDPEREDRCAFDCALDVCAKASATSYVATSSQISTSRGGRITLNATADVTDCGPRDIVLFVKRGIPADWDYSFDCSACPSCSCPAMTGRTLAINNAIGNRSVKLIINVPQTAAAGKYTIVISLKKP